MKNKTLEELFVKTCIAPSRQGRILFELQKPGKRNDAIERFSHDADYLLNKDRVVMTPKISTLPPDFLQGDIWAMYLYDAGGKAINSQEMMQMIDDEYGPMIFISNTGRAIVKTEDNDLYLLAFKVND